MLIRFRFGTAVLMADTILVEHLRHFCGDHVAIVRHGNEGDFLAGFRCRFWIRLFFLIVHVFSIHPQAD